MFYIQYNLSGLALPNLSYSTYILYSDYNDKFEVFMTKYIWFTRTQEIPVNHYGMSESPGKGGGRGGGAGWILHNLPWDYSPNPHIRSYVRPCLFRAYGLLFCAVNILDKLFMIDVIPARNIFAVGQGNIDSITWNGKTFYVANFFPQPQAIKRPKIWEIRHILDHLFPLFLISLPLLILFSLFFQNLGVITILRNQTAIDLIKRLEQIN